MERMVRSNTQYLAVVESSAIFGTVSISDVIKMRLERMSTLVRGAPEAADIERRVDHFTRHLKSRQSHA
jgi:hypothetical protein